MPQARVVLLHAARYNDTQAVDDDEDVRLPSVVTGRSLTIKFSRMFDLLR